MANQIDCDNLCDLPTGQCFLQPVTEQVVADAQRYSGEVNCLDPRQEALASRACELMHSGCRALYLAEALLDVEKNRTY